MNTGAFLSPCPPGIKYLCLYCVTDKAQKKLNHFSRHRESMEEIRGNVEQVDMQMWWLCGFNIILKRDVSVTWVDQYPNVNVPKAS